MNFNFRARKIKFSFVYNNYKNKIKLIIRTFKQKNIFCCRIYRLFICVCGTELRNIQEKKALEYKIEKSLFNK